MTKGRTNIEVDDWLRWNTACPLTNASMYAYGK